MATNRVQDGKVLQHLNGGGAISSGDVVVIEKLVAVALVDIANGDTGSVAITQVYDLPKVDAAVIAQGEAVHYDVSTSEVDERPDVQLVRIRERIRRMRQPAPHVYLIAALDDLPAANMPRDPHLVDLRVGVPDPEPDRQDVAREPLDDPVIVEDPRVDQPIVDIQLAGLLPPFDHGTVIAT